MTIVATVDNRNSQWSQDPSSYGRKMLEKMGWKGDSHGLGKNQQGTTTNLRAIRRAESLGIGAETDAFGSKGWEDTNRGFHGVLASLQKEYGGINSNANDEETKKKRRKEEKKRRKKEEKQKAKSNSREGESRSDGNTLRLAQNKVQAGHARKMREAKDIRNKSAEDMAAVFGFKAEFYKSLNSGVNHTCEAVEKDSPNAAERKENGRESKSSKKRKSKRKDVDLELPDGESNDEEKQNKKKKKDKKSKV